MTKPAVKEKDTTLFGEVEAPEKRTVIREGSVKKNLNPPPTSHRPPAPKSQVAPKAKKNEVAVIAQAKPQSFLEVVAKVASDPAADAPKARAFLDMQMEIMREDARMAFTTDFIALQKVLPVIDKDGKIDHGPGKQKNLYATYPNIMKVVKPLLRDHNFALSSFIEPSADATKINVVSQLDHVRGHFRKSIFPLGAETSGSKNAVQGWGSSQSYGMRYNAIGLLSIISQAPEDIDRDGAVAAKAGAEPLMGIDQASKKITPDQAKTLIELVDNSGVGGKRFCEKYGLEKVGDLPAKSLAEATKALENYAVNNKAT